MENNEEPIMGDFDLYTGDTMYETGTWYSYKGVFYSCYTGKEIPMPSAED